MDDLFQGLLSTGRGHVKTQRTAEGDVDPTLPPFGAVFDEDANVVGTSGAIPVPPLDSAPVALVDRLGTSAHALMGFAQTTPDAPQPGGAVSVLGRANAGDTSSPAAPFSDLLARQDAPKGQSLVPAMQPTGLSHPTQPVPDQAPAPANALQNGAALLSAGHAVSVGAEANPRIQGVTTSVLPASIVTEDTGAHARIQSGTADRMVASSPLPTPEMPESEPKDRAIRAESDALKSAPISPTGLSSDRAETPGIRQGAFAAQHTADMTPRPQNPAQATNVATPVVTAPTMAKSDVAPVDVPAVARSSPGGTQAPTPILQVAAANSAQKGGNGPIQPPATAPEEASPPAADNATDRANRTERFAIDPAPQRMDRPTAAPPIGPAVAFAAQAVTGATNAPGTPASHVDFEAGGEFFGTLQSAAHTPSAALSATAAAPFHAPANAPTLMAQQIAAALQDRSTDPGQPLELALDPPELGRVRMHMAELAGVLTLTIHAERPETAELMRRHLDLLAQEFAEAGVDAPSVRISQDGAGAQSEEHGQSERGEAAHDRSSDAPNDGPSLASQMRTAHAAGALDLRL